MSERPYDSESFPVFIGESPQAGLRLDRWLGKELRAKGISRGRVRQWIESGLATVDGDVCTQPGKRLERDQKVILHGREAPCLARPERGSLRIVHRDEDILVLDKPAGLTTHPAPSCPEGTLVHRLLHHFPEIASMDAWRPGIVHRLDKDTSGLLVVARNEAARIRLSKNFENRKVNKEYLALVHGVPDQEGAIDLPIGRDPSNKTRMAVVRKGGREASSAYVTLWSGPDGNISLVRVRIFTGRTHQIRVHMAAIGHPLLGDAVYGPAQAARLQRESPVLARLSARQMLHAHTLAFSHPLSGERLRFSLAPPKDFRRLPLLFSRRVQKVVIVGMPGSGKSMLLEMLSRSGHPVFSADRCVNDLYAPGADGWLLLKRRFGERFVPDELAPVDKRRLFEAMSRDTSLRREVEAIVHPLVLHRLREFYRDNRRARVAFAEVPLLFEAGWAEGIAEEVVGIRAPDAKRRTWLRKDRGVPDEVRAVLESWQWPEERKMRLCDHVVENDGDLEKLAEQTLTLLGWLKRHRRKHMLELRRRLSEFWHGTDEVLTEGSGK